jgi:hypothetical protein
VSEGDVPGWIVDPVLTGPWLQAGPTEALLRVRGAGDFYVRDGRVVRVAMDEDADPTMVATCLEGPVAALVLVQQGRFALHASTVRVGDRLVAVSGASGAGKSTAVALLAGRGRAVVTDEVTAVDVSAQRVATVHPSHRGLRLWPDTMTALGIDPASSAEALPAGKRGLPIPASEGSLQLGLVVALRRAPGQVAPEAHRLTGLAAAEALMADTYTPQFSALRPAEHLRWVAALAAAVPVVRLDRPEHGWTADAVADAVVASALRIQDGAEQIGAPGEQFGVAHRLAADPPGHRPGHGDLVGGGLVDRVGVVPLEA